MKLNTLLYAVFVLYCTTGCRTKSAGKSEAAVYTVTNPLRMDTTFAREYVSQLQSIRNIEIRAQEKGYLQNIYVDEGQFVKAGQILFRIMPKMYEAEVLKAKAAVLAANAGIAKAKAEVKMAETELLNAKSLAGKQIVSRSEQTLAESKLESEKSELNAKYSELEEAKAELALAQVHLSLTEIKAPFDGIIDRIPHKLGSLIDEGELLTSLSDNKNIFAYFNFTEIEYLSYKARISDSTKEHVSLLLANNELYQQPGIIETIEGEFDNNTGTIAVRAKFPNPDLLIKHGETGKVRLNVPVRNALLIPQKATYELQDKIYVYVLDKDNTVKSRSIAVQQKLSNLYIVASGLDSGDKILLDGLQTVKEDEKITPKFVPAGEVISSLQLIQQ